ncbi:MAG: hypothetical protein P1U80_11925 [Pseudomonadales bacterium]|nr:hypothetical protein [Pseudomonadales bacterium]
MRDKDDYHGGWVEPVVLSDEQKQRLEALLPQRPKATPEQTTHIIKSIEAIAATHRAMTYESSKTDTYDRLKELKALFKRANRLFDGMDAMDEKVLDQYFTHSVRKGKNADRFTHRHPYGGSQLGLISDEMEQTIDLALCDYKPKQTGRKKDYTYAFLVSQFAEQFHATFPNLAISPSENTPFFKLTGFMLRDIFDDKRTDPGTQIKHFIAEHERKKHL